MIYGLIVDDMALSLCLLRVEVLKRATEAAQQQHASVLKIDVVERPKKKSQKAL